MTPVLVISGIEKKIDFELLKEFPCTSWICKPFTRDQLIRKVEALSREKRWYQNHRKFISSLIKSAVHEPGELDKGLTRLFRDSPDPLPLAILMGRMLVETGDLVRSEKILERLRRNFPENVSVLNELGKIYHLKGDYARAVGVLRSATKMSPTNLLRTGLLGESCLNQFEFKEARQCFEQMLQVDGDHPEAGQAVRDLDEVEKVLETSFRLTSVAKNYASLMNTIGISRVKSGRVKAAMRYYEAALQYTRDEVAASKVMFNLGLACLRKRKHEQALDWFQQSAAKGGEEFKKAVTYVENLLEIGVSASGQTSQRYAEAEVIRGPEEDDLDLEEPDDGGDDVDFEMDDGSGEGDMDTMLDDLDESFG